jgi:hydroxyethylthiazole kinase
MATLFARQAGRALSEVRAKRPLVHHITNWVTISECASITRAVGALPVMAHAADEVEEMVGIAGALVLNIGTLTPELVDAMVKAGKKANEKGIPVVLDAVGAGATKLRTESVRRILADVKVAVVKGNAGEIATAAGGQAEVRGVESVSLVGNAADHARALAKSAGCAVAVTGVVDIVTDGRRTFFVKNGHPRMGEVVGTGCMAASVIGAFCAVEKDSTLAAACALCAYDIAGEKAALDARGPGSMKVNLFDAAATLVPDDIYKGAKVDAA